MTNFEHLRHLPVEQIADLLYRHKGRCSFCLYYRHVELIHDCPLRKSKVKSPRICKQAIAKWLVEEVQK